MTHGVFERSMAESSRSSHAACGDEGLSRWCALLPEDYVTDAEPRGEVEVKIVWKHDRKYRRSMANLLGSLFSSGPAPAGSVKVDDDDPQSSKTSTKSMPPKEKKAVDPVRRAMRVKESGARHKTPKSNARVWDVGGGFGAVRAVDDRRG